jgi:hypothetical protein
MSGRIWGCDPHWMRFILFIRGGWVVTCNKINKDDGVEDNVGKEDGKIGIIVRDYLQWKIENLLITWIKKNN